MAKRNKRSKKFINYPQGYPYILYEVKAADGYGLTVAATDKSAIKKVGMVKAKAKPAELVNIIGEVGHSDAHRILRKFGARWMTKEGRVFYKNV